MSKLDILEEVLQSLTQRRDKLNEDIAETRQMIAEARAKGIDGSPEILINQKVRVGEFKGMEPAEALTTYLNARGGGPIKADQCLDDLRLGGNEQAIRWGRSYEKKKKGHKAGRHDFNIMVSQNRNLFFNKAADTVELVPDHEELPGFQRRQKRSPGNS